MRARARDRDGAPFALLKTGHLLHHRYSRTSRERTEIYDPAATSWSRAAPAYYARLFGGLYLAEVASVLLLFAPARLWRHLSRRFDSPETVTGLVFERVARARLGQFRFDATTILILYPMSFVAYRGRGWLLLAAMLARAVLVSLADNAYHYQTRLEAPLDAMNLRLPRPIERLVLAFNLHSVHHRHPGLRWYELRSAFVDDSDRYHLGWFGAVTCQLRGPVPATAPDIQPPVRGPGVPPPPDPPVPPPSPETRPAPAPVDATVWLP